MFGSLIKVALSQSKEHEVVDASLEDIKFNSRFRNPSEIKVNGSADCILKIGLIP